MIKAMQACISSTALHGVEAGWLGLTRTITQQGKKLGIGVGWYTDLLDNAIIKAIRGALPAWRTTPNRALHRDSSIPPAVKAIESRSVLGIK